MPLEGSKGLLTSAHCPAPGLRSSHLTLGPQCPSQHGVWQEAGSAVQPSRVRITVLASLPKSRARLPAPDTGASPSSLRLQWGPPAGRSALHTRRDRILLPPSPILRASPTHSHSHSHSLSLPWVMEPSCPSEMAFTIRFFLSHLHQACPAPHGRASAQDSGH